MVNVYNLGADEDDSDVIVRVETKQESKPLTIGDILEKYPKSDVIANNVRMAKEIVNEHYINATKDVVLEIIDFYLKPHFDLKKDGISVIKTMYKDYIAKLEKEEKEAEKKAKKAAEDAEKASKLAPVEKEPDNLSTDAKVSEIENGLLASVVFDSVEYACKTTYIVDKWQTTLFLNGKSLGTEEHTSPMYIRDKTRDNNLARAIMVEFGKTGFAKYLKPIYELIDMINATREILDTIETKAIEAEVEAERLKESEENKKKAEHIIEKVRLYDTLCNKSGKCTIKEIMQARHDLCKQMMQDFWSVEGFNMRSGNMGHLSLKKLEIADYIQKAFNIVHFGGRNWWYDWEKAYYTYDPDDESIKEEIVGIMKRVGDGELYKYNGNAIGDTDNIIHLASNDRVRSENPFNKAKNVINARNGVLALDYENKTVKMLGKKPDYMFSYCIDTIYDENASSTEIDAFLDTIVGPVQRELIYQIAALAIRDTDPDLAPSKIAYIFFGARHTGKNTVQNLLMRFFGKRVVSHIPLHEIIENKYVKPLLEGKLLNLDDELPSALQTAESREIKSLTGGKMHTLEPKNVKPYEGVITALMCFAGNQFPKCAIARSEEAFWARWDVINFCNQFKVDEAKEQKIFTEANLSGFFNKVIRKIFEIHDKAASGEGITRNVAQLDIYKEWMCSSSTVYRFIQEATIETKIPTDNSKDGLFWQYNHWCDVVGIPKEDRAFDLAEFGKELVGKCNVKVVHSSATSYIYRMYRRYEEGLLVPFKHDYVREEESDEPPAMPSWLRGAEREFDDITPEKANQFWDSMN